MNASATPTFIPVCCVCGLAREVLDSSGSETECWSDFDAYLNRHGLRGTEYRLTHTYCPVCVHQYIHIPTKKKSAKNKKSSIKNSVVPASQADITTVVLQTVRQQQRCDLDTLVRSCPHFTWNQIFLAVDRLSRSGNLSLTLSDRCRYEVTLPAEPGSETPVDRVSDKVGSGAGEVHADRGEVYSCS